MRISTQVINGYLYLRDLENSKRVTTRIYVGECDEERFKRLRKLVFSIFDRNKHKDLNQLIKDVQSKILAF